MLCDMLRPSKHNKVILSYLWLVELLLHWLIDQAEQAQRRYIGLMELRTSHVIGIYSMKNKLLEDIHSKRNYYCIGRYLTVGVKIQRWLDQPIMLIRVWQCKLVSIFLLSV